MDIREDKADLAAGGELSTPRAIDGPLYIAGGCLLDLLGNPVPNAMVDVWHCNDLGRDSHFDPTQPDYNLRRRI